MKAISARLGMSAETLRKWVRQAEVDAGEAAGVPTYDNGHFPFEFILVGHQAAAGLRAAPLRSWCRRRR